MSDDPLAGLPRPIGEPGTFSALGSRWTAGATALGHTSQGLIAMTGRLLAQAWSGQAAMACGSACVRDAGMLAMTADAYDIGGAALSTYATQLQAAQALWDRARRLADQALADERQHVLHLEQQAQHPTTTTTPGTATTLPQLLGAAPVPPASTGPFIPSPIDFFWQSPLRATARAMAQQAIDDAERAANTAAGAMEQTVQPFLPKAPPAAPKKESHWYSPFTDFADGAWDAVKDPAVMIGGLVGLNGDTSQNWANLWGGLEHGFTHPLDFGKALIDWQDLSHGNVARWLGALVPTAAAAFFTGGAAAGVKGADAVGIASKTGKTLDDLTEAEKAALLARGEPLVPGSVGLEGEAKYLTAGGDLDYSGVFDSELRNFTDITTKGPVTLDSDLWLANLHDGTMPLNTDRSLKFSAPLDEVLGQSRGGYVDRLALPPQWGPRSEVSIIHIPEGTDITLAKGGTAGQPVNLTLGGHDTGLKIGTKSGGGVQVLLKEVDKNWVVWTGKAPWPTPGAVAGKAAAGGLVIRVPDALSDLAQPPP